MRPTRLLIEGFTAFRQLTEVDFTGADLFALTGPTGSGKSSVIDAVVFALYGCVPRLDRKAVEPVISLGRSEARVILEFTVDGVAYTAARVVRRTKTGATTKEARLERGGEVLAGNAREVTDAVTKLLGLTIDHFTTCVVLPQGEFMRLLHAAPGERQELLISLLDLGLYERMARIAKAREGEARRAAEVAEALLHKVAFATPEALAATEQRTAQLRAGQVQVEAAVPELDRLGRAAADAQRSAEAAAEDLALLGTVEVPGGLDQHSALLADARAAVTAADGEAEQSTLGADRAEEQLAGHPSRSSLEAAQRAHLERGQHLAQQAKGQPLLAEAVSALASAQTQQTTAETAQAKAAEELEHARWAHRAQDLAASLAVGEPCPVCQQAVQNLPDPLPAHAVDDAREAGAAADAAVEAVRRSRDAAQRARDRLVHQLESIAAQVAELDQAVAQHPDAAAIDRALVARTEAEGAERTARQVAARAQKAAVAARRAVQEVEQQELEARRRFDRSRDQLGRLDPPAAAREDLAADWAALAEWAAVRRPATAEAAEAAEREANQARVARTDLASVLSRALAAIGVRAVADGDLRGPVAAALATAQAEHGHVVEGLSEAARQQAAHTVAARDADLARELHRLLNANHFEKWVLDEALAVLVAGATELLLDLSQGAYSLALDGRANFLVVDHRNADEVRPARTLSGGETFLASLALALGLADQIGSLAAEGSARLESIFLDEGFGTLDPETLDTVAAAIEELGARGRMVGLISHVPELAERVPVRYSVTRDPAGSTIEKVVA